MTKPASSGESSGPLPEGARSAFSSSTRLQILLLCEEAPQTSPSLVAQLAVKRGVVNRHLAALVAAGLVLEVGRRPVSGGSQASYRAVTAGWGDAVARIRSLVDQTGNA